jgi:hypothetical protein
METMDQQTTYATTEDVPEGLYLTDERGTVYRKEGTLLRWATGGGMGGGITHHRFRAATNAEIEQYEAKRAEAERYRKEQHDKEVALLAKYDLTHDDFCRFRSASEEGGVLHVRTRENGIGGRSIGAIRAPNFRDTETDDFDSTYQYYTFTPLARATPTTTEG